MSAADVNPAALGAPLPLAAERDTSAFACRHESLNTWLQKRALANAASGAYRTYVVCPEEKRIVGYCALAAGSLSATAATSRPRKNMPDLLPVIVLGRLAVHGDWGGRGIGSGLLKDAIVRSIRAAALVGVRALTCPAIDDDAKAFYLKHGFVESPLDPLTLMLVLKTGRPDAM